MDLTTLWFYKPELDICAYVFDSHRPFCHKNINDPLNKVPIIKSLLSHLDPGYS